MALNILMILMIGVFLIGMTTATGPDTKQKQFIDDLNEERRRVANWKKISNMHELSWDEELQNTAETLIFTDPLPDAGKTWRYTMISGYDSGIHELNDEMNIHANDPNNRVVKQTLGPTGCVPGMEHILPLQKSVACAEKDKLKDDNLKLICLFGPQGKFGGFKHATPGSNCTDDFQNNNGLCSRPPKTTLPTPTETVPANPTVPPQPAKYVEGDGDVADEHDVDPTSFSYSISIFIIFLLVISILISLEL